MARKQVTIIGAGIGGLTLGRVLRSRGVPVVLYERSKRGSGYSYSITLHSWAYEPLLKLLNLDFHVFRNSVGLGELQNVTASTSSASPGSFRVHRSRFEDVLREGLDVRCERTLVNARRRAQGLTLGFENGEQVEAERVVVADGALSPTRKLLLPHVSLDVQPFAVINGKRWLAKEDTRRVTPYFANDKAQVEHRLNDVLLQSYVNEYDGDRLSITFTYSRPARSNGDPLHKPNRPNAGAKDIPEAFYEELSQLGDLGEPFKTIFDPSKVRESRKLHWLMRSALVPKSDVVSLAKDSISMLGDALHAMPILGSIGANAAIADALELGECITNGGALDQFYETRYDRWEKEVDASVHRLAAMHESAVSAAL